MEGSSTSGKKLNLLRITVTTTLAVVTALTSPGLAQLTSQDISQLQEQAENEGWTFTISQNPATEYSLDQLCGLVEPADWRTNARIDISGVTRLLPDSFDWRELDGCPPVRNQGSCGGCWAFGTVGALECAIKITDGITVDLSEQWLISCNFSGWNCNGGWMAHDYHQWRTDGCGHTGAVMESEFPYTATNGVCQCPYSHPYTIESWAYVGSQQDVPGIAAMQQAIMDYGPITVSVHANSAMQAYGGGIFNACESGEINHAVMLVGWNNNPDGVGYWIMRNSWGSWWGEGGYMRMPYGCSRIGYAACYVEYRPIHVTPQISMGPVPLNVDFGADVYWTSVDSYLWDFGDGTTSTDPTPTHEYQQPGYYGVSVTIESPEGQFGKEFPGSVMAHADTLATATVEGIPGQQVRVDFNLTNYVPVGEITLPFTWDGPLALTYDYMSRDGLRTEYFENERMLSIDTQNKRMVARLEASETGSLPYLEPGAGPILSVYFTLPAWAGEGSNPISISPLLGYSPQLVTYAGSYAPGVKIGSVQVGCCDGITGNVDNDTEGIVDIGDLTLLIGYLFIPPNSPPVCLAEANTDGDPEGVVDIGDVTALLAYLFIAPNPIPANCR